MPTPKPATYLVLDTRGRVVSEHPEDNSDGATVVVLAEADVATLARIAFNDCPDLARRGTGLLGAGTHPAQPYLEVMLGMRDVTAANAPGMTFGHDRVADVVNAFVSNASTWRGDTARAVKAALKVIGAKR